MAKPEHYSWTRHQAEMFCDLMLRTTTHHAVIFFDREARITGWSEGAYFITGFEPADVIGQSTAMLFTPEDRDRKLDQHEINTALIVGAAEDERWHVRKNGSWFWSTGICLPLRDNASELAGFVKIFRDATHMRTRMKYMENALRQSEAGEAVRDTRIGTIVHELRNPLSPLKAVLHLLQKEPDRAAHDSGVLQIMERQLGLLDRLVEDLVDLTRANTGKLRVAYQRVELQRMLTEALDACQSAADARRVTLHRLLPPSPPLLVSADPQRINQVVVNLLNNAIKFTPAGGAVWLTATVDQTHFVVYVKDNGTGIGADLLPRIFDMFTQARESDSSRGAGLGIGLALVKEIVSLHRGTIEVRSEGAGKGSEFTVRIPRCIPRGDELEPIPRPAPSG